MRQPMRTRAQSTAAPAADALEVRRDLGRRARGGADDVAGAPRRRCARPSSRWHEWSTSFSSRARGLKPSGTGGGLVTVVAPVDGVVLKRLRESASVVPVGEPLLEIGDPASLEIVSDLLSTDAVRVRRGAPVLIDQWGGNAPLEGRVRRVEPSGFMKVSALGVEEQRVNVIIDFAGESEAAGTSAMAIASRCAS